MNHGRKFIGATLLICASFGLQAASLHIDLAHAQQVATQLTTSHDFSTWLLIGAGCVGVVVARNRINKDS